MATVLEPPIAPEQTLESTARVFLEREPKPQPQEVSFGPLRVVHAFWLAGMSCDGCTIAVSGATSPGVEGLLTGTIPGLPKVILHHPVLSVEAGDEFVENFRLAEEGKLGPPAPVTQYVPELKDSAYGDATVRQVMDMTTAIDYSEEYADPDAGVWKHARAGELLHSSGVVVRENGVVIAGPIDDSDAGIALGEPAGAAAASAFGSAFGFACAIRVASLLPKRMIPSLWHYRGRAKTAKP